MPRLQPWCSARRIRPAVLAACGRCGALLRRRKKNSLKRTLAFTLAALILCVPANLYPILRMEWYGAYSENTVWEGCQKLFEDGQWLVSVLILSARADGF